MSATDKSPSWVARRDAALAAMADHVLREGLAAATLRALAAAAGTSDRMLLYYFPDKDALLTATLETLAARLAGLLDAGVPAGAPLPYAALLARVRAAVSAPALRPYLWLWLELAAAAARGREPHRRIAGGIADGFIGWAAARLRVADEADRLPLATLLVATIDGLAMLDAVGRGGAADAAG